MHTSQKIHPLTGQPITPIGRRANGRLIWPIMGGSEAAGAAAGDSAAGAGGEAGAGDGAAGTGGDEAGKTGDENPWADPEKAKAEIERLRRENGSARTSAKEQAADEARKAVIDDIAKTLGLKEGDKAPTVESLTTQLTDLTGEKTSLGTALHETRAELVVWQNAKELGVDPQAVTDSRAFIGAIKDLDPADKTFAADVKKAAQEAAEANPRLKAVQVAGKSGAELNGGTGEGAVTKETFNAMSGSERNDLFKTNPSLYNQLAGRE